MTKPQNEQVEAFLQNLSDNTPDHHGIITEIRDHVFQEHPKAEEKVMYGGIVFLADEDMFSGLFSYKKHVSIEFSNGFLMNDPDGKLEGNGKYRRHLKISRKEEISDFGLLDFVKQAVP